MILQSKARLFCSLLHTPPHDMHTCGRVLSQTDHTLVPSLAVASEQRVRPLSQPLRDAEAAYCYSEYARARVCACARASPARTRHRCPRRRRHPHCRSRPTSRLMRRRRRARRVRTHRAPRTPHTRTCARTCYTRARASSEHAAEMPSMPAHGRRTHRSVCESEPRPPEIPSGRPLLRAALVEPPTREPHAPPHCRDTSRVTGKAPRGTVHGVRSLWAHACSWTSASSRPRRPHRPRPGSPSAACAAHP